MGAIAVASVFALASVLAGAPPADAFEGIDNLSFSPVMTVAPPFGEHAYLTGAMDARGEATLVWNTAAGEAHTLETATIAPGSAEVGPVSALSGVEGLDARPAFDETSSGRTAVAWYDERENPHEVEELLALQVRNRLPDGRLEPLQTVWRPANPNSYTSSGPTVAVDSSGDEVVAWTVPRAQPEGPTIMVVTRRAGGAFTAPIELTPGSEIPPAVAISPSGEATVLWCGHPKNQVLAATWPAGGGPPSTPTVLEQSSTGEPQYISDPQIRADASGDEIATWLNGFYFHSSDRPQAVALRAAWRRQGTPFSPAESVTAPGVEAREPAVALDPEHGALIAWSEITSDGSGPVFNYATASVDATFTAETPSIAAPSEDEIKLQAAWLPDGSALMSWRAAHHLIADHWMPGGALATPSAVTSLGQEGGEPLLAAGGSSAPVLAWIGPSPLDHLSEAVRYTTAGGLVGPGHAEFVPVLALAGSSDPVRERGAAIEVRCTEACALAASARVFGLKSENAEEAGGDAYHEIGAPLTLHRTLPADKTEVLRIRSTPRLLRAYCSSVRRDDKDAVEVHVSVRSLATDAEHTVVLGETPDGRSCSR